jgi:hypothetical protein
MNQAHQNCQAKKCRCGNSQAIENDVGNYINELSRILFSKKTLRGDKSWWLPVFCTLCIQSFVKKLLQELLKHQNTLGINPESGDKYLNEVVQLFTALSSGFDPIMNRDGAQLEVRSVRRAIFHRTWLSNRTQNSFQYLKSLFYTGEDSTIDLSNTVINVSPIAMPRPKGKAVSLAKHSRTTMNSDDTKHEENLFIIDHGSINEALFNAPPRRESMRRLLSYSVPRVSTK